MASESVSAGLHKCETPDCLRLVSAGSVHCCGACALAAAGKYEIHASGPLGHSEWCNERAAERGPWLTPAQAAEKSVDDALAHRRGRVSVQEFGAIHPSEGLTWHD